MSVTLVNIFGITSTRLLECLDVLNISEVVEAQECMCNLKIVLHYFLKTLGFQKSTGVPGGPKHFSEVLEATEPLASLLIFLYDF